MVKVNRKLWNSWLSRNSHLRCSFDQTIRWDNKHNLVIMDFTLWHKIMILILFPILFIMLILMYGVKDFINIITIPISLFDGTSKKVEYVNEHHNINIYNKLVDNYGNQ